MKTVKNVVLLSGACLLMAAPLHSQFAVFNPDSSGFFSTVAGPDNSEWNSGVAVSGSFEWDSTILGLRVIVNNNSPFGAVMDGFGFLTPAGIQPVTLDYHDSPGSYTVEQPFANPGSAGIYNMSLGAGADSPAPSNGLQPGQTGIFDFQFTGIAPANFSYEGFGFTAGPDQPFSTSFRFISVGQDGEGSEKFGGFVTTRNGDGFTPVPEPSTYGLFAVLGLLGVISLRRFKSKKA